MRLHQGESSREHFALRDYDKELDSVSALLSDLCSWLHEQGTVEFLVSGFGEPHWPVDVETDLAVVLEQLPEISSSLRAGAPECVLDFYEQGVQRQVWLRRHETEIELYCTSGTDWQPAPRSMRAPFEGVPSMLQSFRDSFVEIVGSAAPEALEHPWFKDWCAETQFV